MSIGSRLIDARRAAGFRHAADVARAAGVTKQYLHNLESGLVNKPDPNKLQPICRALAVSMEWVITGKGESGRTLLDHGEPDASDLLLAYSRLPASQQVKFLEIINRLSSKK